jgi:S-adenosylmethionine:tRNA ribosyltransferase-isomerase
MTSALATAEGQGDLATTGDTDDLAFELPPELEAHEPPEAAGRSRDDVRLLVSVGTEDPVDSRFPFIGRHLRPGDLLVVNTSATVPAALDGRRADGQAVAVHLSTPLPDGRWLVEVRAKAGDHTEPLGTSVAGERIELPGRGHLHGRNAFQGSSRLTVADLHLGDELLPYLARYGQPIRYRHVPVPWPIGSYQTVFADEPGSAEMPSAARPFTAALVTRLVSAGIGITPITLHTGVSSLESHEAPYPERFSVPEATADRVRDTRRHGGRVIAVGTTAVRALETAVDRHGRVRAAGGWTQRIVTPADPPRVVDGLLTGWHEPRSSHLQMLEAVAGRPALQLAYGRALALKYRWHEFGDLHLLLPAR